jgi:hypothetical protein
MEGRTLLLIRGDLIFGAELLETVLSGKEKDVLVTNDAKKPVGLCRLSPNTAQELVAAREKAHSVGEADRELFSFLEGFLGSQDTVPAGERPWARVVTMEDLARALKANRTTAEAQTAKEEAQLEASGEGGPSPVPQNAQDADFEPVDGPTARDPVGGLSFLPRPLLRVLHR